jgi:hypothetical protein
MGSCASILCSKLSDAKRIATVNGGGCVPDDKAPDMNSLCLASHELCKEKCWACRGGCMCACHAVIDTCKVCSVDIECVTIDYSCTALAASLYYMFRCNSQQAWEVYTCCVFAEV